MTAMKGKRLSYRKRARPRFIPGQPVKQPSSAASPPVLSAVLQPEVLRNPRIPTINSQYPPPTSHRIIDEESQRAAKSLWYYSEIELKKLFPQAWRIIIRKNVSWIFLCLVCWSAFLGFYGVNELFNPVGPWQERKVIFLWVALAILAGKIAYQFLYRLTLDYKTHGFRMYVSRGVLFRNKGSLPLLPITEVYVRQSALDFLFGLFELHVVVPVDSTRKFLMIDGLNKKHANALQEFIADQLSKQIFLPEIPTVNKETGEFTEYRQFAPARP